jgi:prepilin peptidase CpaA
MTGFESLVLVGVTGVAALTDARAGRIPNALTVPVLVISPLARALARGQGGLEASIAGAVLCAVAPLALFSRRAMGGGDVKLFAAIGAVLGPSEGLAFEFLGFVTTALFALGTAWRDGLLRAVLTRSLRLARWPVGGPESDPSLATGVRMGVPVFFAALVACRFGLGP